MVSSMPPRRSKSTTTSVGCETCRERVALDRAIRGSLKKAVKTTGAGRCPCAHARRDGRAGRARRRRSEAVRRTLRRRPARSPTTHASSDARCEPPRARPRDASSLAHDAPARERSRNRSCVGLRRQAADGACPMAARVSAPGFSNDDLVNQLVDVHRVRIRPETPDPKRSSRVRTRGRRAGARPQLEKNARFVGGRLLPDAGRRARGDAAVRGRSGERRRTARERLHLRSSPRPDPERRSTSAARRRDRAGPCRSGAWVLRRGLAARLRRLRRRERPRGLERAVSSPPPSATEPSSTRSRRSLSAPPTEGARLARIASEVASGTEPARALRLGRAVPCDHLDRRLRRTALPSRVSPRALRPSRTSTGISRSSESSTPCVWKRGARRMRSDRDRRRGARAQPASRRWRCACRPSHRRARIGWPFSITIVGVMLETGRARGRGGSARRPSGRSLDLVGRREVVELVVEEDARALGDDARSRTVRSPSS